MPDSIPTRLRKAHLDLTTAIDSLTRDEMEAFMFIGEIRMLVDHAVNEKDEERVVEGIRVAANMIEKKYTTPPYRGDVVKLETPNGGRQERELSGAFRCVEDYKKAIGRETSITGKTMCRLALIICFANQVIPGVK